MLHFSSAKAEVMQRASSARRTHVPETTLSRLFENPSNSKGPMGTSSRSCAAVAVQCNPTSTLALSDALLLRSAMNETGVLTTEHARDRIFMRIMSARFLATLQEIEATTRLQLEAQRQEALDVIMAARKMVPIIVAPPIAHGRPHHEAVESSMLFGSELGELFSHAIPSGTPLSGATPSADEGEVDELRRKVRLLELRSHNSFHHYSVSSQSRSVAPPRNMMSIAAFALKQMVSLHQQVEQVRSCVLSEERACRWYIYLQVEHVQLGIKEREARRTLLHVPFTSYRPKIPIENSLAGEEFLRRWLLVETLQHYEDNGVLLQEWENCKRNALEDEEQLTYDRLFPETFLPVYKNLAGRLQSAVNDLSAELHEMKKKCDIQRNAAYLDVIVDEETRMRAVVLQSESEATILLRGVMAHMESVTHAAGKAQRLQEELARQRKRHNGEMRALSERVQRAEQDTRDTAEPFRNESSSMWIPSPPSAASFGSPWRGSSGV